MADFPQRDKFERELSGILLPLAERHRRELVRLMGNPPDATKVPPEFWEQVRRDQEETLAAILLLIVAASASLHGASDEDARQSAATYAARRAALVAAEYAARSRELAFKLAEDARKAAAAGTPIAKSELGQRFDSIFGESRGNRIAVTETTAAATAGGEAGASLTVGLSLADIWWTEEDARVCEICRPLHRKPRQEWMAVYPSGPPAHPMCRCFVEYRGRLRTRPREQQPV